MKKTTRNLVGERVFRIYLLTSFECYHAMYDLGYDGYW